VFSAALEQAEQLFTAAGAADARIRPMLLFYGISQASRAIAAAAKDPELNGKGRWQIVGHGLSCDDRKSRGLHPSNLAETQMVAAGGLKSGLRTMQRVLGSPAWKVDYPVELGEVFAALPTLPTFPGRDDWPAAQFEARLRPPHFDAPEHHVTAWVLRVAPDDDRTWARFAEVPNHYGPLAGTTMKPENSVYPVNEQGFLVPLIAELPVQRQPRYKLTPGGPQPESTDR